MTSMHNSYIYIQCMYVYIYIYLRMYVCMYVCMCIFLIWLAIRADPPVP